MAGPVSGTHTLVVRGASVEWRAIVNSLLDEPVGRRTIEDRLTARPTAALVVVGDAGAAEFLRFALSKRCALVEVVSTTEKAELLLKRYRFDVATVDSGLPGIGTWLDTLQEDGHELPLILLSDDDTPPPAGGATVLAKPFALEHVVDAVERALAGDGPAARGITSKTRLPHTHMPGIVSHSEAMQNILATIQVVATRNTTVLLQGESGSGKEVAARCLHHFSGRDGLFVPVNCSAIAPELIESELFGHTRGAFTGATQARQGLFSYANGGTLFLDEIGELPLAMQAKLLRVLEDRTIRPVGQEQEEPIDVRIIAATNRDIAEEVARGRFREDLYYRLNVIVLRLPPLRERPSDIPHLIALFSRQFAQSLDVPPLELDEAELQRLLAYPWPGNVRELRNVIERAMLLGLPPSECLDATPATASPGGGSWNGYPDDMPMAEVERLHSLKVLQAAGGNKSEAARRLGISRKTLERKLKLWGEA